ncbi:MAG: hypothetical protein ACOYJV_04560 [Aminivibrio sp.]|jgi:hypothetical protein
MEKGHAPYGLTEFLYYRAGDFKAKEPLHRMICQKLRAENSFPGLAGTLISLQTSNSATDKENKPPNTSVIKLLLKGKKPSRETA